MAVVSMSEILKPAFEQRYGVGAFNIVNDLTLEAILAAAATASAPVIIQVSLKTVKAMGARLIQVMFAEMARKVSVPATLHLDHCPDLRVIEECLEAGWNSVLFDGSGLSYDDNLARTKQVVALAKKYGAAVEGELEAVKGVEDGVGNEDDKVNAGDVVLEIESDKAVIPVEAYDEGILVRKLAREGQVVKILTPIGDLE